MGDVGQTLNSNPNVVLGAGANRLQVRCVLDKRRFLAPTQMLEFSKIRHSSR